MCLCYKIYSIQSSQENMAPVAFYGRKGELESLQEAYTSRSAQMAIVYGRRRIGKTALIRHFCSGKPSFCYTAKAWKNAYQLQQFSKEFCASSGNSGIQFSDWTAALRAVAKIPSAQRKVIFIDEFQYIAKEHPAILSEIQILWDEELSQENVFLILCGSAVSFIAKEVLGAKNPLYGRARTIMKVRALPFKTLSEFAPNYTVDDLFKGYACLGGVPYFWLGLVPERPMTENLAAGILRSDAFLNDEAQSVLREEFREPATYNAILQSIAFGATAKNEIAQKSLVDVHTITKYLDILEEMELVVREFPVLPKKGEPGNATRGLYRIADPYLKFWFRYLASSSKQIMTREEALMEWNSLVEPGFSEFASESFEDICLQYLTRQYFAGKLPFAPAELGRWWNKSTEIDIVGVTRDRRQCLVAECKYRTQKIGMRVLRELQGKCAVLPVAEDAEFHYWLFSRSGFEEPLLAAAARDPYVHLVGMENLLD